MYNSNKVYQTQMFERHTTAFWCLQTLDSASGLLLGAFDDIIPSPKHEDAQT